MFLPLVLRSLQSIACKALVENMDKVVSLEGVPEEVVVELFEVGCPQLVLGGLRGQGRAPGPNRLRCC